MAVKTNFYLNNSLVNPPKNWQELSIDINFDKDRTTTQQISITDWEFVRENSEFIDKWIEDGKTTGVGALEGIPLRLELERNGAIEKPFDGYIDLADSSSLSCNDSTVKSVQRHQIDWLNDIADSFTYEYLYRQTGEITKNDFVFMPYVINSVPNYTQSAVCLLSVYVLQKELTGLIEQVKALTVDLSNPFTTANGILKAVLLVAYIAIIIISLIKLLKDMIYYLIQPVKYHAGMYAKTLLEKGAKHLGLNFKSDIFSTAPYDKLFILPEKFYNPLEFANSTILGFLTPNKNSQEGFYKGTFGDFLRAMKTMFNAKIVMDGNDIHLVRRDINLTQPQFTLPDIYNPIYRLNANEAVANYYVKFQTDLSDKNTIQQYLGTTFQVILQPKVYNYREFVLLKHLETVEIPFALAKRKEILTLPEEIVKAFLDVFSLLLNGIISVVNAIISLANLVIKLLNKIIKALKLVGIKVSWQIKAIPAVKYVSIGNLIDNRIGMMMLETDQFNVTKAFVLSEGNQPKFNKLPVNNTTIVSAKELYNKYHYTNSFIPTTDRPNGNQYIIKQYEKVPFTYTDYVNVKKNNYIFTTLGVAEVVTLKWNTYNQYADMTIRINKLYTNNLTKVELQPDGR